MVRQHADLLWFHVMILVGDFQKIRCLPRRYTLRWSKNQFESTGNQWYSSGLSPPCCPEEQNKGGGNKPEKPKSPDFGPFALEIWPKNTTNFPAAKGGQKAAKQGGGKAEERGEAA